MGSKSNSSSGKMSTGKGSVIPLISGASGQIRTTVSVEKISNGYLINKEIHNPNLKDYNKQYKNEKTFSAIKPVIKTNVKIK